jgi:hypothetical protein
MESGIVEHFSSEAQQGLSDGTDCPGKGEVVRRPRREGEKGRRRQREGEGAVADPAGQRGGERRRY